VNAFLLLFLCWEFLKCNFSGIPHTRNTYHLLSGSARIRRWIGCGITAYESSTVDRMMIHSRGYILLLKKSRNSKVGQWHSQDLKTRFHMGYAITLKEITDATVNDSQDWVDSGF